MNATNFEENLIPQINNILKFALKNEYSDFYREKYSLSEMSINSFTDFSKISILTKKDINLVPINKRTFIDSKNIAYYSCSSGTTGKPTIIPHGSYNHEQFMEYVFNEKFFRENGVRHLMTISSPLAAPPRKFITAPQTFTKIIQGDMKNLTLMAMISKEIGVQAFFSTPTIINFLVEELEKIKFDFTIVRWVSISGEFCSALQYTYLKEKFPKAFVRINYGNAEIGSTRHYQCEHLKQSPNPNSFHLIPDSELVEIIDDENQCASFGESGNIIHTDLIQNKAFPMIRYNTGDIGSLSNKTCPCGQKFTLTLDGRAYHDVLKFSGIVLRSEMIFKALESSLEFVEKRFQMHVFEEKTAQGKIQHRLELQLKKLQENPLNKESEYLTPLLEERISTSLKLSSNSTLKDLISRGIFLPLEIKFVSSWPKDQQKNRNIISHF